MQKDEEDWFTPREQAHAAILFVVLFAVVATVRLTTSMPVWLLFALGPAPFVVPIAVASWERHTRRGRSADR